MADKNIVIKKSNGSGWDSLYPVTKASNVVAEDGTTTFESYLAEGVTKTTADITYYVSPTGNDGNNGLTSGTAFKTIQYAINKLPQVINHTININVAPGTYSEVVSIKGYYGSGTLNINGGTDITTAQNYNVTRFSIGTNNLRVNINGITSLENTNVSFSVYGTVYVRINYCVSITASAYGFFVEASVCVINNCLISNKNTAIEAIDSSTVFSNANSGTGNQTGLASANASTIGKSGTQPSGATAESTIAGGVIR